MANSTHNTRTLIPADTGTIINIISELENMKDTYLVKEKHRIGEYNLERVLEIVKNTEFLREIARSLDEEGNKEKLEKIRSFTTEDILAQMENGNKLNKILNYGIVIVTLAVLSLIPILI